MKLKFWKMQGCGNDYVYIDCFSQQVDDPAALAVRLSDRHFGVGGDGLILACPSDTADARMRMFNADGSEGRMCGNGIRCVAKLIYDSGIAVKPELSIETLSGVKRLALEIRGGKVCAATVDMGAAVFAAADVPVITDRECVIDEPLMLAGQMRRVTCVSMGNPHCVLFTDDVMTADVSGIGAAIERDGMFPERVNVEFVRRMSASEFEMRVWERGSGETLACGTGACAAAAAAAATGRAAEGSDITVHLTGGDLRINYTPGRVLLTGGAELVFIGEAEL